MENTLCLTSTEDAEFLAIEDAESLASPILWTGIDNWLDEWEGGLK